MEPFKFILYNVDAETHVATITLNRPRYRNALHRGLTEEVAEAFDLAEVDDDVRVVVVKGAGPVFSAGHDLGSPEAVADRELRPTEDSPRGRWMRGYTLDVQHMLRIRDFPKPTIAQVHGHCIFAGWMLASSMDVVIAGEGAQFAGAFFQYFTIPWDLGVRNAKGALFEGNFLSAAEVHRMGLVYRVVPDEDLDGAVSVYAARVAEGDPFRLRMLKHQINQVEDMNGFRNHIVSSYTAFNSSGSGQPRRTREERIAAMREKAERTKASATSNGAAGSD